MVTFSRDTRGSLKLSTLLLFALIAKGSTLTVTNLLDSGPGSLRNEIAAASAGDIIAFNLTGTISLTSLITIGTNLTINGSGIVIDGSSSGEIFTLTNSVSESFSNLTLRNASGGAIDGSTSDSVSILDSTISGNGLGLSSVNATVTNSTFSGNTVAISGGTIGLYDSTIIGGTFGVSGSTLTIGNSIVYGNTADLDNVSITDLGHNLVDSGNELVNGVRGDIVGQNPDLGPLANNGGPTRTYALMPGSPAIDNGSDAIIPSGITMDQRGLARISGSSVDIGAFEVQQSTPEPATYVTCLLGLAILAAARVLWGGAVRCHLGPGPRKPS